MRVTQNCAVVWPYVYAICVCERRLSPRDAERLPRDGDVMSCGVWPRACASRAEADDPRPSGVSCHMSDPRVCISVMNIDIRPCDRAPRLSA